VSAARTTERLLRLFPPSWRDRYGEELADVIVESSGDRVPWRVRLDVLRAGGRERLRAAGLSDDGAPQEQVRGGALLVLCAWALFVIAGLTVQKLSEHWQTLMPVADRGLPQGAFDVLVAGAVVGAILVMAGIAAVVPGLRTAGWHTLRRALPVPIALTGVAVAATVAIVAWAHGLAPAERDGHDAGYAGAFVAWALLCAACLLGWTCAAVSIARRLDLRASTLRAETWLAVAVTALMALMATATVVWWGARGTHVLSLELTLATALMVIASALGAIGSRRALRALPAIG
jgi:hypothetical protein